MQTYNWQPIENIGNTMEDDLVILRKIVDNQYSYLYGTITERGEKRYIKTLYSDYIPSSSYIEFMILPKQII